MNAAIKTKPLAILRWWQDHYEAEWPELPQSADWDEPVCWGCQYPGTTEPNKPGLHRAHLIDRGLGGSDDPSNLVLLCRRCNLSMPSFTSRQSALDWIRATPSYIVTIQPRIQNVIDRALRERWNSDRVIAAVFGTVIEGDPTATMLRDGWERVLSAP